MADRNNENNPFVEIGLQALGSIIIPAAFWGAAAYLYTDSRSKGYYNLQVEELILGLIAAGTFPGIPAGIMLGIAIAEARNG